MERNNGSQGAQGIEEKGVPHRLTEQTRQRIGVRGTDARGEHLERVGLAGPSYRKYQGENMLGFIKVLAARARRSADEAGQNLVETALIIGIVSIVLVGAFMATNIDAAMTDVADQVICIAQSGTWTPGAAGTAGTCS